MNKYPNQAQKEENMILEGIWQMYEDTLSTHNSVLSHHYDLWKQTEIPFLNMLMYGAKRRTKFRAVANFVNRHYFATNQMSNITYTTPWILQFYYTEKGTEFAVSIEKANDGSVYSLNILPIEL